MGDSISDGLRHRTKHHHLHKAHRVMSLPQPECVASGVGVSSEALELQTLRNLSDQKVPSSLSSGEVRNLDVDENEAETDVDNIADGASDTHRLLPTCERDEYSVKLDENFNGLPEACQCLMPIQKRKQAIKSSTNTSSVSSSSSAKSHPPIKKKQYYKKEGLWSCLYQCFSFGKGPAYNINALIQSMQGDESSLSIVSQVSLPFLIAGYGTVAAGMVLDIVQHWPVFFEVKEIFILVPALLGLKGNLEMTLASRLSTQANLGNMDTKTEVLKMVGGNMSLIQAQAIVVGFLSSLTAMIFGWIPKGEFNIHHGLLLCASSLFTAAAASLVLGSVMVVVVLLSRYFKINPDNVATPIAASLGDLVTLTLLAWVSNLLFQAIGKQHWLAPAIIVFFLLLLPLWVTICVKNKYTNDVIYTGWIPVLSAMLISSVGGLILDYAVSNYDGIAVFQPIINGVGGNLVAVHSSRISTSLHMKGKTSLRSKSQRLTGCLNIFKMFFGSGVHSRAVRVLVLLTVPGHLLFTYTVFYMKAGHTSSTVFFQCFYLSAALLQVILLLYIATWLVPIIWIAGSDPDNVAIPYLTAIGDLLGTGFLAVAFHLLYLVGDRDADIGD